MRGLPPVLITALVLVAGFAACAVQFPNIASTRVVGNLLTDNAFLGIVATGMTFVIISGGIDLSVGSVIGFTTVFVALAIERWGVPPLVAFVAILVLSAAFGAAMGAVIHVFDLPPFIVTLGTWSIFGALNVFYSRSETIRSQDLDAAAPFLLWMGKLFKLYDIGKFFGMDLPWLRGWVVTYGSVLMIVLAIVLSYILTRTAFGRHVYATGDDPDAARLSGINTNRTLLAVYVLAGLICAIAAWVLIGRIGGVSPQAGQTANLDSITAVVIGGTSLFGGRGSIIGTLFGALIVGVFRNGLALSGLELLWQDFAVGVLIIVAVTIDQWIRKIST